MVLTILTLITYWCNVFQFLPLSSVLDLAKICKPDDAIISAPNYGVSQQNTKSSENPECRCWFRSATEFCHHSPPLKPAPNWVSTGLRHSEFKDVRARQLAADADTTTSPYAGHAAGPSDVSQLLEHLFDHWPADATKEPPEATEGN